jgi:hypothetical protein
MPKGASTLGVSTLGVSTLGVGVLVDSQMFEDYKKTLFVNLCIRPLPCCPFHYFVNYSLHYNPHVLILSKCLNGFNLVLSLGYSNNFFIILQILSSMLEIKVYSIIDSKVFSVTIGDNFLFTIVVKRFYDCKHVIEEQRMQLTSTCAKNAN